MLPGVLLVKCGEGAAKAPFSGLRIDGQRVQDHDLVIRRVVLPRSTRVNARLKPVEDAGAHHGAVRLLHEQVAPLQRASAVERTGYTPRTQPTCAGPASSASWTCS